MTLRCGKSNYKVGKKLPPIHMSNVVVGNSSIIRFFLVFKQNYIIYKGIIYLSNMADQSLFTLEKRIATNT